MSTSSPVLTLAVYNIDPAHTSAHFSVRHLMISNVRGEFSKVSGTVTYDPSSLAGSKVEASIDASSINTREPQRDAHLKSADFLDVEHFPEITFKSTKIAKQGDGFLVTGQLTIRGTSKEVGLKVTDVTEPIKDPWGFTRLGATASTKINRKDFGLNWNQMLEAGGLMVGDEVNISIDVELVQQKSA